ncbi:hypothetical protein FB451DRAFT_1190988 [Mycena latifolia]|nr:hypothetical protein FB451DRAFT_1190988 [Mycena latifolia]
MCEGDSVHLQFEECTAFKMEADSRYIYIPRLRIFNLVIWVPIHSAVNGVIDLDVAEDKKGGEKEKMMGTRAMPRSRVERVSRRNLSRSCYKERARSDYRAAVVFLHGEKRKTGEKRTKESELDCMTVVTGYKSVVDAFSFSCPRAWVEILEYIEGCCADTTVMESIPHLTCPVLRSQSILVRNEARPTSSTMLHFDTVKIAENKACGDYWKARYQKLYQYPIHSVCTVAQHVEIVWLKLGALISKVLMTRKEKGTMRTCRDLECCEEGRGVHPLEEGHEAAQRAVESGVAKVNQNMLGNEIQFRTYSLTYSFARIVAVFWLSLFGLGLVALHGALEKGKRSSLAINQRGSQSAMHEIDRGFSE